MLTWEGWGSFCSCLLYALNDPLTVSVPEKCSDSCARRRAAGEVKNGAGGCANGAGRVGICRQRDEGGCSRRVVAFRQNASDSAMR